MKDLEKQYLPEDNDQSALIELQVLEQIVKQNFDIQLG